MTTDELRGGQDGAAHPSGPTDDIYDDEISVWALVRTLWSYRRAIVVSVSGIFLVFLLLGFLTYVFQPMERHASVEFRLIFDGVNRGEYPNGLRFSSADIIGVPVLTEVYEINELERYFTYELFKNRLFILEANSELELLRFEYQARLADLDVTPIDRTRLEEEFREKREALAVGQYGLNFVGSKSATSIPDTLLDKVLGDVLTVWAEQAVTRKGVLTYQVNLPTMNLLLGVLEETDDYSVQVDILRGKVNRLIASLSGLEDLPGASTLRGGENRVSLPEIRVNLEDLLRYRLEPLTDYIWANGISGNSEGLGSYFENRKFQITLDLQEAEQRGKVIEDSLREYLAEGSRPERGSGVGGAGGSATGEPVAGVTALIPQIGDSFLDRIMAMGGETSDVQYRQELTDEVIAARQEMVSLTREMTYYNRMSESVPRALGSPPEEMVREVETRLTELYDAVVQAVEQSNATFEELSAQNLNPRTNLFTITRPFAVTVLRPVTLRTLWPIGLLTLMFGLVVVPLVCLIHYYFRREIQPEQPAREPDVPQQEEPKARVETGDGP